MYHRVFEGGHKSRYIITPAQMEDDLIALKEAGYTAVLPRDVIAYVEGTGKLPDKPVMLTFDDGHYNNLHYVLPLMQRYGMSGVVNIIGKFCRYASTSGDRGKPESSFLAWDEVKALHDSGIIEIGAHTYNMHNYKPRFGIKRMEGETDDAYLAALVSDDTRLRDMLMEIGIEPNCFAYPFGAYHSDSKELVSSLGYKMIFTTNRQINRIKRGDADTLLSLGRINRESEWSGDETVRQISGDKG